MLRDIQVIKLVTSFKILLLKLNILLWHETDKASVGFFLFFFYLYLSFLLNKITVLSMLILSMDLSLKNKLLLKFKKIQETKQMKMTQ